MQRILVINPNSDVAVTEGIAAGLAGLVPPGVTVDCETLPDAPPAIETEADIAAVAPMVAARAAESGADAVVIACYSDPGLAAAREAASCPVIGIAEAAVATALARAERFGVIALSEASIRRHTRHLRALGLLDRRAGERAAALGVAESGGAGAFAALAAAGRALVAEDGAEVVVLGCAGMARQRAPLAAELGVPVIEPCRAAVAIALGALA